MNTISHTIRGMGLKTLLLFIPLFYLAIFYFYPVIKIMAVSFSDSFSYGQGSILKLLTKDSYLRVISFTLYQAFFSTVFTLAAALPCTYIFVTYDFPGKSFFKAIMTVPFVLPTVVVASAFQALLGNGGLLNLGFEHITGSWLQVPDLNHTVTIIISAHVFYNFSVIFRIVGGFWSDLGNSLQEAAATLGASPFSIFFKITMPLILPAVLAASLLVFIFCFSSFGVIMILGGPGFSTIETEIFRQAVHMFNLPMAAALSLIQIVFTFLMMWIYTRLQRRSSLKLVKTMGNQSRRTETIKEKTLVAITLIFLFGLILLPLLALVYKSLVGETGFTLYFYKSLFINKLDSLFFVPPGEAILNSLLYAGVTLLFSLILGISASLYLVKSKGYAEKIFDPLFMLPLSTSAVTLGFGFIIALDSPPLNLRSSPLLVPLAHSLVAFPFVVRAVLPALRSIPPSLREAACMLGASEISIWKQIDLPVIARAMVVGAVFAFSMSIGEFGATAFVARPEAPTMPLAIYRFLGQPGSANYGQAMAMSTILMSVTSAGFLVIDRSREKFRISGGREF